MSAVDRRRDPASPSTVSTSDLELHHGGALLELCPERAAFRPDREELLVADVHLGKASAFRRAGRPIPHGTTATELERLDALVARKSARRLTFLGDLFHDSVDPSGPTARRFRAWLERRDDLEITLVRGNHDRHAVDLIEELPLRAVPEPADASPLAYRHHPSPGAALHVAGHVHPGVRLDDGSDRLRLPVFWRRAGSLVLPAFGSFTGLQLVEPEPDDDLAAVTPTGVVAITNRRVLRSR